MDNHACNMTADIYLELTLKKSVPEMHIIGVQGKGRVTAPVLEFARACIIGMRNLLTAAAWKHVSAVALL